MKLIKRPETNITTVAVWAPKPEIKYLLDGFDEEIKRFSPSYERHSGMLKIDYLTKNNKSLRRLILLFDSNFEPYNLSVKERIKIPHPEIFMSDFNKLAKHIDLVAHHLKNETDRTDIFIANRLPTVRYVLDFSGFYKSNGDLDFKEVLNKTLKGISNYSIN